jgi:hypothetical protein
MSRSLGAGFGSTHRSRRRCSPRFWSLAAQFRAAGDAAILLPVGDTGHQLDTAGQQPTVGRLGTVTTALLDRALSWTPLA